MKCFLKVLVSAVFLIPFIILEVIAIYVAAVVSFILSPLYFSGCYDGNNPMITVMDFIYDLVESWRKL